MSIEVRLTITAQIDEAGLRRYRQQYPGLAQAKLGTILYREAMNIWESEDLLAEGQPGQAQAWVCGTAEEVDTR